MNAGVPRTRRSSLIAGSLLILSGFGMALGGQFALDQTNSMVFCTSCHSMQIAYQEYQQSTHFSNALGTQASCSDCHVPRELGDLLVAKVLAARDVLHEVLGTIATPEQYAARRWELASRVWDKLLASDSRTCRHCHQFEQMDLDAQDHRTARKHRKAEAEGETCIVCHKGIAHKLPDPPAEP